MIIEVIGSHAAGKSTVLRDLPASEFGIYNPSDVMIPAVRGKKLLRKAMWPIWILLAQRDHPDLMAGYKRMLSRLRELDRRAFSHSCGRFEEAICATKKLSRMQPEHHCILEGGPTAKLIYAFAFARCTPCNHDDINIAQKLFALLPKSDVCLCVVCEPTVSLQRVKDRRSSLTRNLRLAERLGIDALEFQNICNDWAKWYARNDSTETALLVDTNHTKPSAEVHDTLSHYARHTTPHA